MGKQQNRKASFSLLDEAFLILRQYSGMTDNARGLKDSDASMGCLDM